MKIYDSKFWGNFPSFKNQMRDIFGIKKFKIEPLWYLGYYDGILSGIFKCADQYFYSTIFDPDDYRKHQKWVSYLLTEDEFMIAKYRNDLFREYFGDSNNYFYINNQYLLGSSKIVDRKKVILFREMLIPEITQNFAAEKDVFGILGNVFPSRVINVKTKS